MDELVEWLEAQLSLDEQIARDAAHFEAGNWTTEDGYPVSVADELPKAAETFERVVVFDEGSPSVEQARHIAEWDPARVLREIETKRKMIGRISSHAAVMGQDEIHGDLLRSLALPYADRPGFKESWRP